MEAGKGAAWIPMFENSLVSAELGQMGGHCEKVEGGGCTFCSPQELFRNFDVADGNSEVKSRILVSGGYCSADLTVKGPGFPCPSHLNYVTEEAKLKSPMEFPTEG